MSAGQGRGCFPRTSPRLLPPSAVPGWLVSGQVQGRGCWPGRNGGSHCIPVTLMSGSDLEHMLQLLRLCLSVCVRQCLRENVCLRKNVCVWLCLWFGQGRETKTDRTKDRFRDKRERLTREGGKTGRLEGQTRG